MWKKALRNTNSLYKQGLPDIMLVIIGVIVSVFFAPIDPIGYGVYIKDKSVLHGVYIVSTILLSYPFVLFYNSMRANYEKEKRIEILKLSELYAEGVNIREYMPEGLFSTDEQRDRSFKEYNDWYYRTLKHFMKVDPINANLWFAIDENINNKTRKTENTGNSMHHLIDNELIKLHAYLMKYLNEENLSKEKNGRRESE